jgi:hypothetical protein
MAQTNSGQIQSSTMTRQESENIDLAEKGMSSPVNPHADASSADRKDRETVLENVSSAEQKTGDKDVSEGNSAEQIDRSRAIIDRSGHPDPDHSQAV